MSKKIKPKKKLGRPLFEITEKVCRKAEEYAAQGLTAEQIAMVDKDNTAMIFYLKNRAGWVDKQETTTTVEQRHVIDLSGIDYEQLTQLEQVLEQSLARGNSSRENAPIIEGVHQELLGND